MSWGIYRELGGILVTMGLLFVGKRSLCVLCSLSSHAKKEKVGDVKGEEREKRVLSHFHSHAMKHLFLERVVLLLV